MSCCQSGLICSSDTSTSPSSMRQRDRVSAWRRLRAIKGHCIYAPACHVHLLPDYIENFDAAVAGGGGEAPSIVVQLHVMHSVSVPGIKTCYRLRHALDCSLPGAGSSRCLLNPAEFVHLKYDCLRASSAETSAVSQASSGTIGFNCSCTEIPVFASSRRDHTQCPGMQGLGKAERRSPSRRMRSKDAVGIYGRLMLQQGVYFYTPLKLLR